MAATAGENLREPLELCSIYLEQAEQHLDSIFEMTNQSS